MTNMSMSKQPIITLKAQWRDQLNVRDIQEIALKALALVATYPMQVAENLDQAIDKAETNHPQAFCGHGRNLLSVEKDRDGFRQFIDHLIGFQTKGLLTADNKFSWVCELLPEIGGREDNPGSALHDRVYQLIDALLVESNSKTLYIPFESRLRHTIMLGRSREVFVEGEFSESVPQLLDLILGGVHYHQSDAPLNPSFVQDGKLQKFDAGFIADPWSCRAPSSTLKHNDRFKIHSNNYDHYLIQHAMQQVEGLLVVAASASVIASSVASEVEMRQWLLNQKHLKAVIALPNGLVQGMSINSVLMVFDMKQSYDHVEFITLKGSQFIQKQGREISLAETDQLVQLILTNTQSKNKATIAHADIAKQGYVFDPDRYVISDDTKQALDALACHATMRLGNLVQIIRPIAIAKLKQEGQTTIYEVQSGDLPEYGYIDTASKPVLVNDNAFNACMPLFLKANDIIITVRGSVGKVGIVSQDMLDRYQGRVIAGQTNMVLQVIDEKIINAETVLMQLRSSFGQARLQLLSAGALIAGVSLKDLKEFQIAMMSVKQQEQAAKDLLIQQAIKQEIIQKQTQARQLDNNIWVWQQ